MHEHINQPFSKMGARVKVRERSTERRWREIRNPVSQRNTPFVADIRRDGRGEFFDFLVTKEVESINVGHLDAKDRHLVLNVTTTPTRPGLKGETKHFLMGHDERHWFIAETSGGTVFEAKASLKPVEVVEAERKAKVKNKNRNKRKNRGSIRQGEWFFIPAPKLDVDPKLIHRDEPIRRSGGKPHMVEELYRKGGTAVMVGGGKYRNGITLNEYNKLMKTDPLVRRMSWTQMTRNPTAYARGKVRHGDHKTIKLLGWHRIVGSSSVAFLD